MLEFLPADYSDILMIFESKLDGTFPSSQFRIYGLEPLEVETYYCL